eukprot:7282398-Pyramimonas_sp.AAC.1
MLDAQGHAATTPGEIAQIAQKYFAQIEVAKSVDCEQLCEEYNLVSRHPDPKPEPILEYLPTLSNTEQTLRKCPPRKAA